MIQAPLILLQHCSRSKYTTICTNLSPPPLNRTCCSLLLFDWLVGSGCQLAVMDSEQVILQAFQLCTQNGLFCFVTASLLSSLPSLATRPLKHVHRAWIPHIFNASPVVVLPRLLPNQLFAHRKHLFYSILVRSVLAETTCGIVSRPRKGSFHVTGEEPRRAQDV